MEPITTAILARGIYDLIQASVSWSKDALKEKLRTFINDETKIEELAQKIEKIEVNEDMSEKAIEKKLVIDPEILEIIKSIKDEEKVSVKQQHFGSGDNVGRDKIVKG
ncbi:GapS6a family protein [Pantoea septica]|uniref:Uncharacterized protein n=1 Tax=Pantoea septica TaxID=472695 RepID=A0ABX3UM34_9GAMM|nr:hypothetical protein [Pantoea septica]ORM90762.1 hypothetical protein HA46_19245 [Pantoea septica]